MNIEFGKTYIVKYNTFRTTCKIYREHEFDGRKALWCEDSGKVFHVYPDDVIGLKIERKPREGLKEFRQKNDEMIESGKRVCSVCKCEKSIDYFYFNKHRNTFSVMCLPCSKLKFKEYNSNKIDRTIEGSQPWINDRNIILKKSGLKYCSGCKKDLPIESFYRSKCRPCIKIERDKYYYEKTKKKD